MFLVSTQRRSFISLPCCSIRRSRFTTLAILLLASFILFHQSFQPGFDTDDNFPPPISSPSPRLSPPLAISPSIRNGTQKDRVIYNLYKIGHMPWLDYLEQLDPDGLAPLTKQVQRWIWEKQHPPKQSCSSQRFLISAGTENVGLGAYLHKQGYLLGAALEAGFIYLLDPVGTSNGAFDFADNCGNATHPKSSMDCLTQPLSSCTVEDALPANTWKTNGWSKVRLPGVVFRKDDIPSYWKDQLRQYYPGATLTAAFFKIWWRGQSAAYLSRLNAAASDAILAARLNSSIHNTWTQSSGLPTRNVPFPLPPGTMNIHVRHGDKKSEMTLMPFKDYVTLADKYSRENPQMIMKRLFVSSEDPMVIDQASRLPLQRPDKGTTPDETWLVYTTNIPRANSGPFQQIALFGRERMTIHWYLQLWMALECDSWFGTRASNWNRIIDEFRCIFVDKCTFPYFEVGPIRDWRGYFW